MTKDILFEPQHDIEQLTGDLLPRPGCGLATLFKQEGSAPPKLIWSPKPDDYTNPMVARFAQACDALAQPDGRVLARDFDINAFRPLQDWLLHLDIEADGTVYRYLHYGDGIASVHGISMLGKTTEGFDGHIGAFFTAVYRAVQIQKDRILTIHVPAQKIFARHWERLIVPLFDEAGNVVQFLVQNIPDNELRPGLDIIPDPVLIVDEDMIVRYANRVARETFGQQTQLEARLNLFAYSGIDTEMPAPPRDLLKSKAVHDVVSLVLRDTLIQRFMLTISAMQQWGTAYYVITMRPAAV